jgi:hypothetical protein
MNRLILILLTLLICAESPAQKKWLTKKAATGGSYPLTYVNSKIDSLNNQFTVGTTYTVGTTAKTGLIAFVRCGYSANGNSWWWKADSVVLINTATSGRQSFTLRDSIRFNNVQARKTFTYELRDPATGAGTVTAYLNKDVQNMTISVIEYSGIADGTPFTRTTAGSFGISTSPATLNVTTESGDVIVGDLYNDAVGTLTVGAGETRRNGNYINNIISSKSATTTTTSFSITLGTADWWWMAAVTIKPYQ